MCNHTVLHYNVQVYFWSCLTDTCGHRM